MKCPYCNYNYLDGEGEFFKLSNEITMKRESDYRGPIKIEERNVFACPSCRKIFIGEKHD